MELSDYLCGKKDLNMKCLDRVLISVSDVICQAHNVKHVMDCLWLEDNHVHGMQNCNVFFLTRTRDKIPYVLCVGNRSLIHMEKPTPEGWSVAETATGIENSLPIGDRE